MSEDPPRPLAEKSRLMAAAILCPLWPFRADVDRTSRHVRELPLTDIFSRAAPSSSHVASGSRSPSKKALIGIAGNDRVHVHHRLKSGSQMQ